MKKNLFTFLLFGCLMLTATISFAQKTKRRTAPPPPKPLAAAKVDLGKLSGNTYTNDFFELKMEFPFGWLVGDNVLESQLMKLTQGGVKTKNAGDQKALDAAAQRLTPLLGGYKALPGSNPRNSSLRVIVEDMRTLPQIKNGKIYLNTLLMNLKMVQLPPGFQVSEIQSETIDNISLDYLETSFNASRKRMYAMVKKGYVVLMTIESFSEEDFDVLHKVLLDADLDYKK